MNRLVRILAGAALVLSGTASGASTRQNHDALLESAPSGPARAVRGQDVPGARVVHRDSRLGVPTFVWMSRPAGGA
ncbi:hypothetical protein ACLESO_32960, partial [Pyxidicoccus sp. 3LG]